MKGFTAAFSLIFLIACSDKPEQAAETSPDSVPVQADLREDVQVVEIEAGASGYSPDYIALKSGVPARLIFTRTADAPCIEHISIPEFGVEKRPLPLGEPVVVEITVEQSGEYTFVCGMNMQEGLLIVSAS